MKLQYRAIEGTNTKTRRLAYITAILLILRQGSLSEQALLKKLTSWSLEHHADLFSYYVHTGEITSTQKNSAASHYLNFAVKSNFIISLSGVYHITRVGSVLAALMKTYEQKPNPFFLSPAEVIFYLYCLLKVDADIFLTVADNLATQEDSSLAHLQQIFQETLLRRLDTKLSSAQDEAVKMQLRDRRIKIKEWRHIERYVEHLVPPRLNWLLDLDLVDHHSFRQRHFHFTEAGQLFLSSLPCLGEPSIHDINDQWLNLEYWQMAAQSIFKFQSLAHWAEISKETQDSFMATLLTEAFDVFGYSLVPRISLTQIMLYLSTRLLLDYHTVASSTVLIEWFLSAPILNDKRYEVRLSPRENESYLIIM